MVNHASPKFDINGDFEGMIGSLVDIHEEYRKEKIIKEKQHLTETIVRKADVATAIYPGRDMPIDLANDTMIRLWGKSRDVIGKNKGKYYPNWKDKHFLNSWRRYRLPEKLTGEKRIRMN